MDLPDPDSMFARGSALVALETRFAEDPRLRCYAHEREGEVEILRFDNGGGDHVWLLRSPDGVLLKAFDHESPVSRYARDAHGYTPDPSLTSGIPPALASFLRREILGHEGDDRTFVAWWADGRWTTRGPDAHPTDRLLLDAAGANEWLADAFDHTADPRALTQVLEVRAQSTGSPSPPCLSWRSRGHPAGEPASRSISRSGARSRCSPRRR